jgi:hypothetical protein
MNDTTEPAPLTEREMNQFIMLAALPTLERALERLRWLEAQRGGLTNPTSIMVRIDEGWITPSDAVREITRLRAEVAELKAANASLAGDAVGLRIACAAIKADRDEARREACELLARSMKGPMEVAADRGWDCFEEVKP